MKRVSSITVLLLTFLLLAGRLLAQDSTVRQVTADSLTKVAPPVQTNKSKIDSVLRTHIPRKATIRSALVPGWGQIYNHKYWKLPIVYGALGISGAVFVYNLKNYRMLRDAYRGRIEAQPRYNPADPSNPLPGDSTRYRKITDPLLLSIDLNSLASYRNDFRRNIDYSVLAFLLLWGLQVVDATVDAHLKTFDVSPDLTLHFHFGHSQMANTTGLSLILAFKK